VLQVELHQLPQLQRELGFQHLDITLTQEIKVVRKQDYCQLDIK
jgi:hypothetical protein